MTSFLQVRWLQDLWHMPFFRNFCHCRNPELSAHVYSSCVAWSRDWRGWTECWGCRYTKTWRPKCPTWSRWHWSFTKPNGDKSQPWRHWGQTFLDLEIFSKFHCSSRGDLRYLVGYCSWLWPVLGYPQLWACVGRQWHGMEIWSTGFERWSEIHCFDGEHWDSWLGSNVAVPHCPDCTHPLGITLSVPKLGGRLGDSKLNRSQQRSANWIHTIERQFDKQSRSGEGVPPAMRVSWIAIYHSKSLAESLVSIEPTRMQTVVGSLFADRSH